MREIIHLQTAARETLVDITGQVRRVVSASGVRNGLVSVYAQGATAAIMIQENWDESVQTDVVNFLRKLIPNGVWLHDAQDGNGDAHLKSGLVGPSETIPLIDGELGLSRWQNIFFCECDGPRKDRQVTGKPHGMPHQGFLRRVRPVHQRQAEIARPPQAAPVIAEQQIEGIHGGHHHQVVTTTPAFVAAQHLQTARVLSLAARRLYHLGQ